MTSADAEELRGEKSGLWDPEDTGLDWMKQIREAQARRHKIIAMVALDFMANTVLLAAILWRVW